MNRHDKALEGHITEYVRRKEIESQKDSQDGAQKTPLPVTPTATTKGESTHSTFPSFESAG
jgi:hypothetical protein